VRLLVRTVLGLGLFAGGFTFFAYGLAQAIENGSCGTDRAGNTVGPPCPSGFGPMIGLMVVGVFAAFAGSWLFASRRRGMSVGLAVLGGMARFFVALLLVAAAAVVVGAVDFHDADTRPGMEIVAFVAATVLLLTVPGMLSAGAPRPAAPAPAAAPPPPPAAAPPAAAPPPPPAAAPPAAAPPPPAPAGFDAQRARAEDVASRLRQLDQLRESGLLPDAEYAERRRQILAEL
jgi:hypothetical protein